MRHSRAGFTLTEILMATGILGVGLTMVATIFPVAVDQSRRSRDQTMAALCARSTAAMLRANRADMIRWCRMSGGPQMGTVALSETVLQNRDRVYRPDIFLYETSQNRANNVTTLNSWAAGGYMPAVYVTPMTSKGGGPWRVIIAVYKTRGEQPPDLTAQPPPYTTKKAAAGAYLIDWEPTKIPSAIQTNTWNMRGEAYMIEGIGVYGTTENILLAGTGMKYTKNPSTNQTTAATASLAAGTIAPFGTTGLPNRACLRDAVIVYTTIIGD
jgi:prepilin-type N-terminal cleavage/methylation domain-containing protein